MRNRRRKSARGNRFTDRLIDMFASLLFAIPTAFVIWLFVNSELALTTSDDVFLGSQYLWGTIIVFALIAFFAPGFFVSVLGRIWSVFAWMGKWFGW